MPVSARTRTIGGAKLKRFLRNAKSAQARAIEEVEVGFFPDARYPTVTTGKGGGESQEPHPVAFVAATNEFGNRKERIPERPFFRRAIANGKRRVGEIIEDNIDTRTMAVDQRTAGLIGAYMVGEIQKEIVRLDEPPNAPITIERKGRDNPLVDTGKMKQSVTFVAK